MSVYLNILGKLVPFDHADLIKIYGIIREEEVDDEELAIRMSVSPKTLRLSVSFH